MTRDSQGARAAALALSTLLVLAGCSGGDDDEPGAESTPTATDPASESPDEGVERTEPGTALAQGEAAVFAWEPNQNRSGLVSLTVDRIDRGTAADLRAIEVNPRPESPRLFYVRLTLENLGESNLGGLSPVGLPVYADDGTSVLVRPADLLLEFKPCPLRDLPARLGQGESTTLCLVYLLDGRELDSVALVPDLMREPIAWPGDVTPPEPEPKPRRKRRQS